MKDTEDYEADMEAGKEADEAIAAVWNAACEDANEAWVRDAKMGKDAAGKTADFMLLSL